MGSFSIWHWMILFILLCTWIVPGWVIVKKAGFSPAWALFGFIPIVNFIMLWVFAFARWPALKHSRKFP